MHREGKNDREQGGAGSTDDDSTSGRDRRKLRSRVEEAVDARAGKVGEADRTCRRRLTEDGVECAGEGATTRLRGSETVGVELLHQQVTLEYISEDRHPEERARCEPRAQTSQGFSDTRVLSLMPDRRGLFCSTEAGEQAICYHDPRVSKPEAECCRPCRWSPVQSACARGASSVSQLALERQQRERS